MLALIGAAAIWFGRLNVQLNTLATDASSVPSLRGATQAISVTATPVSAVGTIELVSKRQVVLMTSGTVAEVAVEVGDSVKKNDPLIALETQHLEWAIEQANIGLENARLGLEQASEAIEASDIEVAEANLLSAQENLALVEAGPTKEELDAAKSASAAAWASYNELKAGPTKEELTQANASLKQAEIDLQQAQRAYDKIAWQPDAGASGEGAALQRASIAYESAKAGYDQLVKPPTTAQLQSALANAQQAQHALNQIQKKPTPAELAAAKANAASAEAALADLKKGNARDVHAAELSVKSAEIGLEQAKLDLANARVLSPIDGVVLEVGLELGQQGGSGAVVATIADVSKLRLVVNVEQKDIAFVKVGQKAEVAIYGLTGKVYHGEVSKIAPMGESTTGSITFPVTIQLTDESLAGLLPGMNATATFLTEEPAKK
jgi:HlyD family secretion protein